MKHLLKFIIPAAFVGLVFAAVAQAQEASPNFWRTNVPSSTITPINASLQVPCANIVGGCGGGGSASGTASAGSSPFVIQGSQSSTITGNGTNSQIAQLNTTLYVPANFATAGCAGSPSTTDFGACVNALYASQSSTGFAYVGIAIPNIKVTQAQWKTPINFNIHGLSPSLFAPNGAELHWGGTSSAMTWNAIDSAGHIKTQDYGWAMYGSSTAITGGMVNNATTTGIVCGGSNGCVGVDFHDISINGFGTENETKNNAYLDRFDNMAYSGWNGGVGNGVKIDPSSNSGESLQWNDISLTDGGNSTGTKGFFVSDNAVADLKITGGSADDAQIYIGIANPTTIQEVHFENSDSAQYPGYPYVYAAPSSASILNLWGNTWDDDSTISAGTPPEFVEEAVGSLDARGNYFDRYGNQGPISIAIDHSISASIPNETVCGNWDQNSAYTNLLNNLPDSIARNNAGCWSESANSYPIAMVANGNNTNSFYSGSIVEGTYDNGGNWVFGTGSGSTVAIHNSLSVVGTSTLSGNLQVDGAWPYPATPIPNTYIKDTGNGGLFVDDAGKGSGIIENVSSTSGGTGLSFASRQQTQNQLWSVGTSSDDLTGDHISDFDIVSRNGNINLCASPGNSLTTSPCFRVTTSSVVSNENLAAGQSTASTTISMSVLGNLGNGIGALLNLENKNDGTGDQTAIYSSDSNSATPIRGAMVWTTSAVGQDAFTIYSGNATSVANMTPMLAISAFNNSATNQTNVSIGTTTLPTTLFVSDAVHNSSTILLGSAHHNGCIELPDEANTANIDYIYASSTALVITQTKPNFCE